eukprot:366438-Chlamydomonas_euryale.AAC.15
MTGASARNGCSYDYTSTGMATKVAAATCASHMPMEGCGVTCHPATCPLPDLAGGPSYAARLPTAGTGV